MPGSEAQLEAAPRSRFALPKEHRAVLNDAARERALGFARDLLSIPTAPYFEDGQVAAIERFAHARSGFDVARDEHGNVLVTWRGSRELPVSERVLAFSAHLDHPGFRYDGVRAGVHRAALLGGVPARFMSGARVRFFAPGSMTANAVARVKSIVDGRDAGLVCEFEDVEGRPARGSFGVFDLPDGVMRGTKLQARVCDDLLGAASILCVLDELARANFERPVAGVFTRAEETGFVGCLGLLHTKSLPQNFAVIGLECSPRRSTAKVGQGPVIRVGDRRSVFDPALTHHLQDAAETLSARVPGFIQQRALMDGGSCESTAYNAFGVPAGAACLALGNYHNCGPKNSIAAEFVDWNDFEGLVALLLEAARSFEGRVSSDGIRRRLVRTWERERMALESSARRMALGTNSRGEQR